MNARLAHLFFFLIFIAICSNSHIISAKTWLIKPDSTGDASTIQAGIDAAAAGDTVLLAHGRYHVDGNWEIDFLGKPIVVRSVDGLPDSCLIDGGAFCFRNSENNGSIIEAVTLANGSDAVIIDGAAPVIKSCIIRNAGWHYDGGAIRIDNSTGFVVNNCWILKCGSYAAGPAVTITHSSGLFTHCSFDGNTSVIYGGLKCGYSVLQFNDCVFANNDAWDGCGGAIGAFGGEVTLTGCLFDSNKAFGEGGGIFAQGADINLNDCEFVQNRGLYRGIAVSCTGSGNLSVSNCVFDRNNSYSYVIEGGAVYFSGSSAEFNKSFFTQHGAVNGGAIYASGDVRIDSCRFDHNSATEEGGAVWTDPSRIIISNSVFAENSAGIRGGAVSVSDNMTVAEFYSNTFYGNSAPEDCQLKVQAIITYFRNCILAFGIGGTAMSVDIEDIPDIIVLPGDLVIHCTNIYGNQGGNWTGLLASYLGGNGNFEADPQFCTILGDLAFQLHSSSPCAPGNHPDGAGCGLIGSGPIGCGDVPVKKISWGELKSLFSNQSDGTTIAPDSK